MTEQQPSILGELDQADPGPWRSEVQARLQRYKTQRGRPVEGAFTMRFPFPPPEAEKPSPATVTEELQDPALEIDAQLMPTAIAKEEVIDAVGRDKPEAAPSLSDEVELAHTSAQQVLELAPEPIEDEAPVEIPAAILRPRPRPRRKVIAFPRPAYSDSAERQRLADPVAGDQLRIVEVPEELEATAATPFLDGLLGPAAPKEVATSTANGIELPAVPASAWERVMATAVDASLICIAAVIFGASAYRFLPRSIPVKPVIIGGLAVCTLLWAAYQYLFLVYGGRTLGMQAAGLRLIGFEGGAPGPRQRRLRVLSLYLSVLSLGMGILWYFVDLDSLCWHDRMSHTFSTKKLQLSPAAA